MRVARGRTLVVHVEGTAVDTSGTGAVGGVATVYRKVRLDALEGIHVRSPFDESKTVEHGKDADIDAVILRI